MKHSHHISLKKSIALALGVAALAVPAGAGAYPMIPDEPGDAAVATGHAWMAAHSRKAERRTRPASKPRPTCRPAKKACPVKKSKKGHRKQKSHRKR